MILKLKNLEIQLFINYKAHLQVISDKCTFFPCYTSYYPVMLVCGQIL